VTDPYLPVLEALDETRRAEVVAALMALEHGGEPVLDARFPALREPALRRRIAQVLQRLGRTLVRTPRGWTSGYRDDVRATLAAEEDCRLPEIDRAVLTLVLIYSVAIPRAGNKLLDDTWLSPFPVGIEELQHRTQLGVGEVESAMQRLRRAGLVSQVKSAGEQAGGYVPGPQFHRLTPAARRELQEELIMAAGPDTPLAASVRARRRAQETGEPS
jgi:DNA-binding transcriptional ArsR family regulator